MHDSSRRRAHRIQLRPHLTRLHTLQNQTKPKQRKATKKRAIVKIRDLPLNTKTRKHAQHLPEVLGRYRRRLQDLQQLWLGKSFLPLGPLIFSML